MPTRTDSNLYGGPSLALANALYGNIGGAGRALVSPESLGPEEAKTLVERWGLKDHPFGWVMEAATNPIVLIGLALAVKWPVGAFSKLREMSPQLLKRARTPGAIAKFIKGPYHLFAGTKDNIGIDVADTFGQVVSHNSKWMKKYVPEWQSLYEDFQKTTGRAFNDEDGFLVSALTDGLHKGVRGIKLRDEAGKVLKDANKKPYRIHPLKETAILEATKDPAYQGFVKGSRKILDHMYGELFETPSARKAIQEALDKKSAGWLTQFRKAPIHIKARMAKSQTWRNIRGRLSARGFDIGDYTPGYLPHQLSPNAKVGGMTAPRDEDLRLWMQSTYAPQSMASAGNQRARQSATRKATESTVDSPLFRRGYALIPDPAEFDAATRPWVAKYVDESGVQTLRRALYGDPFKGGYKGLPGVSRYPGDQVHLPIYRLGITPVITDYMHATARTYSLTATGLGKKLVQASESLRDTSRANYHPGDSILANILDDQYMPIAAGKLNQKQAEAAMVWSARKKDFSEFLDRPAVTKAFQLAGETGDTWRQTLRTWLETDRGPFSMLGVSGELASLLYSGTLGANVGAAAVNSLQTILTTANLVGFEAAGVGFQRTFSKASKYFGARLDEGLIHEKAFAKTWPEFVDAGLTETPMLDDVLGIQLDRGLRALLPGDSILAKGHHAYKNVQDKLMGMFSTTEAMNRLVAYEGGLHVALKEKGLKSLAAAAPKVREEIQSNLRWFVESTQFLGGAQNAPASLATMNPLWRQYQMFPRKMLEFVTQTLPGAGSGAGNYPGGINWGNIGRAAAGTGIAYESGMGLLDTDLSGALLGGALPIPQENNPFYPFPFVPPAVGIAGSVASDLFSGKWERTKYALPMLVPGGTAVSRMAPILGSQGLSQMLGRNYADYNTTTPDGRVPIYSDEGKLIGFESQTGLLMRGLGLPGHGDMGHEAAFMKYLIKNRDRLRGIKRQYMDALVSNDYSGAASIAESYKKAFGMDLVVKDQDIKAVQMRRTVPRLESVMMTLPEELRPAYAEILTNAVLSSGSQFLGYDPQMLSQGSSRDRNALRPSMNQPGFPGRSGSYQLGTTGASSQPQDLRWRSLPDVHGSGGLSFGGF